MEDPGFLDYRIPVSSDLPAIANAIERAVGRRPTELPISPARVFAAIDAGRPA
jgi:CO/xanthine dehydrogenase Mo-binding subunit